MPSNKFKSIDGFKEVDEIPERKNLNCTKYEEEYEVLDSFLKSSATMICKECQESSRGSDIYVAKQVVARYRNAINRKTNKDKLEYESRYNILKVHQRGNKVYIVKQEYVKEKQPIFGN